jgi:hypothetical protein
MDTFIVRIYRRIAGCLEEPAGTIERVGTGERVGFSDSRELLERLLAPDDAYPKGASACAGSEEQP